MTCLVGKKHAREAQNVVGHRWIFYHPLWLEQKAQFRGKKQRLDARPEREDTIIITIKVY